MKNAKRILITTTSREVFIVRRNGKEVIHGFCPDCGQEVQMLTLDQSIHACGQSAREIVRRVENGDVHFQETADGLLLLCKKSL